MHGILQARILEWAAIPFSGNLPDPGIKPWCPALQADSLLTELPGKYNHLGGAGGKNPPASEGDIRHTG